MSDLKKGLTLTGLTMIVIGSCIGSGIFVTPADSFKVLPHHGYVLLAWLLGGFIAFFGAMTFSELSARFPKAGGVYVFLKEAYGDWAGFLYGWIILLIVNTGALAALCVLFTDFLGYFFVMTPQRSKIVAISTLVVLTGINIIGVNISGLFAKIFTGLKLVAIAAIVFLGIIYFNTENTGHQLNFNFADVPDNLGTMMLLAFVGVFFSFGGWHHATYLSAEIENPQKIVPRAMLLGTFAVTITYLLIIVAYSSLLPMEQIMSSEKLAGDAVGNVISGGGKLVTIGVSISIFGTIGIYTMTAPRIYYAMAKDKIFFNFLAKVHTKYRTPYLAMIFQCVWAIVLILVLENFPNLMTFATFMDILFMALATSTIFFFRRNRGNEKPAYLLKWYPIIPIVYLVVTVAFVINTIIHIEGVPYLALLILLIGIPVFFLFKKFKKH